MTRSTAWVSSVADPAGLALLEEGGDPFDETELVTALRVEHGPGDQQFLGDVKRQGAHGAEQGAGRGDHPATALREREARGARCDHQVAGERDLEAAPERRALDRGDERLAAAAPDHAVLAATLSGAAGAVPQVAAGREHRRRAGDDTRPQLVVVLEQVERLVDAAGGGAVDGVPLGLAVDADDEDPVPPLAVHGGLVRGHSASGEEVDDR